MNFKINEKDKIIEFLCCGESQAAIVSTLSPVLAHFTVSLEVLVFFHLEKSLVLTNQWQEKLNSSYMPLLQNNICRTCKKIFVKEDILSVCSKMIEVGGFASVLKAVTIYSEWESIYALGGTTAVEKYLNSLTN